MALTQETILTFLLEHGGKVKNSDLLSNYTHQINCSDPAEKKYNRDIFKTIINSIAVVKEIDDIKYVVVKKRYQEFLHGGMHLNSQTLDLDDSLCSQNMSFSPSSLEHSGYSTSYNSGKILNDDIENNNSSYASIMKGNYFNDNVRNPTLHISKVGGCPTAHTGSYGGAVRSSKPEKHLQQTSTIKVINVSADHGIKASGKTTGPVFAIVAVKSPPQPLRDSVPVRKDGLNIKVYVGKTTSPGMLAEPTMTKKHPDRVSSACGTGMCTFPGAKSQHPQVGENQNTSTSPQLMRTPNKLQRKGDDSSRVPKKEANKDLGKYYDQCVPMEPAAHQWLVKSAAGLWSEIHSLLLQNPQLAQKKDLISGFTALHWAAKGGNADMVCNILEISRKGRAEVDVNGRTHAGYTPLHIAAIHSHDVVIALLVRDYGARVNVRDNNGKKPYHYLEKGVSFELRELLGDPHVTLSERDRVEDQEYRELPRGLNPLGKFIVHRRRHRHQTGEDSEEERKDVPQLYHRRHFSDIFHQH